LIPNTQSAINTLEKALGPLKEALINVVFTNSGDCFKGLAVNKANLEEPASVLVGCFA
jgi:hypothetical protein